MGRVRNQRTITLDGTEPVEGVETKGKLFFEKPILTCPQAPLDRFLSVKGTLITVTVHEELRVAEEDDLGDKRWAEASSG